MGEVIHTTRVRLVKGTGRTRKAMIEGFEEPVYFGVNGGSIDHMVAAISSCMVETLAELLAGEEIGTSEDVYRADVEGDLEETEGIRRLAAVRVRYHLKIKAGQKEAAQKAFEAHLGRCPAAQSVRGCIRIHDELELEEVSTFAATSGGEPVSGEVSREAAFSGKGDEQGGHPDFDKGGATAPSPPSDSTKRKISCNC
jgi:uncharacterized OsmC-like protein